MKRRDLEKHLRAHGCEPFAEDGPHQMWRKGTNGPRAPVPRHREIKTPTVTNICKQLQIPKPRGR